MRGFENGPSTCGEPWMRSATSSSTKTAYLCWAGSISTTPNAGSSASSSSSSLRRTCASEASAGSSWSVSMTFAMLQSLRPPLLGFESLYQCAGIRYAPAEVVVMPLLAEVDRGLEEKRAKLGGRELRGRVLASYGRHEAGEHWTRRRGATVRWVYPGPLEMRVRR